MSLSLFHLISPAVSCKSAVEGRETSIVSCRAPCWEEGWPWGSKLGSPGEGETVTHWIQRSVDLKGMRTYLCKTMCCHEPGSHYPAWEGRGIWPRKGWSRHVCFSMDELATCAKEKKLVTKTKHLMIPLHDVTKLHRDSRAWTEERLRLGR